MKITFYSNFLTHHQLPFCLEMVEKYGEDYKFVSTIPITEERLKLGYQDMDKDYDFVVRAYENEETYQYALQLAVDSDIVIMGSTSDEYIVERLKQDKLTFRYRERLFYDGWKTWLDKEKRKTILERHYKFAKNKNLYMLCASAYGANDFYKIGKYKDKIYKWGYFPKTFYYDIEELTKQKEQNNPINILWTGRFKKWKNPDYMVKLAERLKEERYDFKIQMLGNGELFSEIEQGIKNKDLESYVELVGAVESDKVRDYMVKSNIFCFTSDIHEGWGAVLNEAMNSGCAVVANKYIGAVPFLIANEESGITYTNFEEFYEAVKKLIDKKELRKKLYKNAYLTIANTWNSKVATENLIKLFESIMSNRETNVNVGPASKALPIE